MTSLLNLDSTELEIVKVQAATAEDVDKAVKAAKSALKSPSWKKLPATDRGKLMAKLADLMESEQELLATIDAWDNGKHLNHSLAPLLRSGLLLFRFPEWSPNLTKQVNHTPSP